MAGEKDRLGEKLHDREKGEEDQYFARQEREALERLREKRAAADGKALRCPSCDESLVTVEHQDTAAAECPSCRGIWLAQKELDAIAARERDSWLGRFFHRPNRAG